MAKKKQGSMMPNEKASPAATDKVKQMSDPCETIGPGLGKPMKKVKGTKPNGRY